VYDVVVDAGSVDGGVGRVGGGVVVGDGVGIIDGVDDVVVIDDVVIRYICDCGISCVVVLRCGGGVAVAVGGYGWYVVGVVVGVAGVTVVGVAVYVCVICVRVIAAVDDVGIADVVDGYGCGVDVGSFGIMDGDVCGVVGDVGSMGGVDVVVYDVVFADAVVGADGDGIGVGVGVGADGDICESGGVGVGVCVGYYGEFGTGLGYAACCVACSVGVGVGGWRDAAVYDDMIAHGVYDVDGVGVVVFGNVGGVGGGYGCNAGVVVVVVAVADGDAGDAADGVGCCCCV